MRKSGELLTMARKIRCPVIAIHGDYDPHPAEGVKKIMSPLLKDFIFVLLKNCGHEPWNEKFAKDEFYQILSNL
jgi:pimeloyl-ACP methyl ester carboxylesterase